MRKSLIAGFLSSGLSIKIIALTTSGATHIYTTDLVDHSKTLVGVFLFSLAVSFKCRGKEQIHLKFISSASTYQLTY